MKDRDNDDYMATYLFPMVLAGRGKDLRCILRQLHVLNHGRQVILCLYRRLHYISDCRGFNTDWDKVSITEFSHVKGRAVWTSFAGTER